MGGNVRYDQEPRTYHADLYKLSYRVRLIREPLYSSPLTDIANLFCQCLLSTAQVQKNALANVSPNASWTPTVIRPGRSPNCSCLVGGGGALTRIRTSDSRLTVPKFYRLSYWTA